MDNIKEGIAERVSHFMSLTITSIICVAMSFAYGWRLTLVIIGYVPVSIIVNTVVSRVS